MIILTQIILFVYLYVVEDEFIYNNNKFISLVKSFKIIRLVNNDLINFRYNYYTMQKFFTQLVSLLVVCLLQLLKLKKLFRFGFF